jgi:hypothetical protein
MAVASIDMVLAETAMRVALLRHDGNCTNRAVLIRHEDEINASAISMRNPASALVDTSPSATRIGYLHKGSATPSRAGGSRKRGLMTQLRPSRAERI